MQNLLVAGQSRLQTWYYQVTSGQHCQNPMCATHLVAQLPLLLHRRPHPLVAQLPLLLLRRPHLRLVAQLHLL